MDHEDSIYSFADSDLDLSFTSVTTDRTHSARSSLARSSLTLSFNESRLSTASATPSTAVPNIHTRPHRRHDNPNWAAINAATTMSSDGALHLRHLKLLRLVGSGNLGRVFLCRLRDYEHANFALKVVDRDSLSSKKLSHVQTEAQILSSLDHPFLPTLYAHLEVSHYTCLLMDYCSNGDLHSLLRKQPRYRLSVQAVSWKMGPGLRSGPPDTVASGTRKWRSGSPSSWRSRRRRFRDLASAHTSTSRRSWSAATPRNGVDWWAFGVLIYELLYGTTPFKGGSKESTLRNIASTKGVRFHAAEGNREEPGMAEARDLIEKLLVKDPRKRLGCTRGATDIKRHPFFDGIKWPLIRTYRPPEVRGLAVKRSKSKANVSHVTGVSSPRRRRCLWKRLSHLMRIKGSKYSLNSNSNYYSYANYNVRKCA
ncbi:UNVERIFIED_CONTAM: Serine/threonine-protein kinase WAG1 [Sesamum radiatum]|uniref:non-specific serine/threonine protein kinase n=1 Tax=Sesamum radiatum TaxID=300843 RepID=A0AAW2LN41_SESRA